MRFLALLVALWSCGVANASLINVVRFDRVGALGGIGGGGEFRVWFGYLNEASDRKTPSSVTNVVWNKTAYDHRTFCVELNENINLWNGTDSSSNVYKVRFSDRAVAGGVQSGASTDVGDLLDNKSANIYWDWTQNRTNAAAANNVQQAIWNIEENRAPTGTLATIAAVNSLVNSASGALLRPEVSVMNVFKFSVSNDRISKFDASKKSTWEDLVNADPSRSMLGQDQVIRLDGLQGPPNVPEPATFALFGMGALAAGFYRARRGSKKV